MKIRTSCLVLVTIALATQFTFASGAQRARQQKRPSSVDNIRTRAEFDRLARVYYTGRGTPMPHLMVAIDRADHDKVYFIDSTRFRFHKEFVNAAYLSLERGDAFYSKNYSNPNRRFVLGTIAYQVPLTAFSFEFNEGDVVDTRIVELAVNRLKETFYAPLLFKANTDKQEEAAQAVVGLTVIRAEDLFKKELYFPITTGEAYGVLRVVDTIDDDTILDRNEIIILKEPPVSITPVSGIINTQPPSPLSHLNVLSKAWNIPNIYARNADQTYAGLVGKYVYLHAKADGFEIRVARAEELVELQKRTILESEARTPKADLAFLTTSPLKDQRAGDSIRFGAKSANLGELINARIPGIVIPSGFSIPFSFYDRFAKATGIENEVFDMLDDQRFNHDLKYRRERLQALRTRIETTPVPEDLAKAILDASHREFGRDVGLFVRSSTNAEDLPYFSGAGLYSTVPNVKGDEDLLRAVRVVWASIWNDRAYEARSAAGISHLVFPGVVVQLGMNADAAGVLVTRNPFNPYDQNATYINAKRGLGIRVVDGFKVAEQILYHPKKQTVKVLTRSADDTALTFDDKGGVREIKVEPGRAVLTDGLVRRLAKAASAIEAHFKQGALDIEWLTIGDTIYIVQVRPFDLKKKA